ncbi:MAG: hypothetical protein SGI92_25285 [Bryobacteraceae bacterium]|nr:hypothetical protein [Bryobacteraceae bacterium]
MNASGTFPVRGFSGGRGQSFRWFTVCFVALAALTAMTFILARGQVLRVVCEVPGASVVVDQAHGMNVSRPPESTALPEPVVFDRVPLGTRRVTVSHLEYFDLEGSVFVTPFATATAEIRLTEKPVPLVVLASAPTNVSIDGLAVGRTEKGQLKTEVRRGQHHVSLRASGYYDVDMDLVCSLYSPPVVRADMRPTPEQARLIEIANVAFAQYLSAATTLYQNEQYQAALRQLNSALELRPDSPDGLRLKSRLEEALTIPR